MEKAELKKLLRLMQKLIIEELADPDEIYQMVKAGELINERIKEK